MLALTYKVLAIGTILVSFIAVGSAAKMELIDRIEDKTLLCGGRSSHIRAYDLAPNIKTVAMLATTIAQGQTNDQSCLVIWDVANQKIVKSIDVTVLRTAHGSEYVPEVLFAQSGEKLILQALNTVAIYKVKDLTLSRVIAPPKVGFDVLMQVLNANEAGTLLVTFGPAAPGHAYLAGWPNISELVDIESGDVRGVWNLEDRPLAVSPNGKWAAIYDHAQRDGVVGISLFDLMSGQTVRLADPQLGFVATGKVFSRLIARFLDNDHLLILPDGGFDQQGRTAGTGIKVVSISQGKIIDTVKPKQFGPVGELAVSGTHNSVATISQFITPSVMTHDVRLPRSSKPILLILERNGTSFTIKDHVLLEGILSLRDSRAFDPALLRIC
jgi:hypothetical protein